MKDTFNCFVYWIYYPTLHTNINVEGYVGVTSNIKARFKSHKNNKSNWTVRDSIKNGAIINCIFQGTENACYELEQQLRPYPNIGWNLVAGGGKPPVHYGNSFCKGIVKNSKILLQTSRTNISKTPYQRSRTRTRNNIAGEKNNKAKLTETSVKEIKTLLNLNQYTFKEVGDKYNVSYQTISNIYHKRNWTHVE